MKNSLILIIAIFSFYKAAFADCPFCNQNVIDRQSVFESESYYVLLDYKPRVKGHLLVVPKRHVVKAHELTAQEWSELSQVIPKIFTLFETYLKTDQYMVLEKNGPRAYQEIPHVHFHLIPVHNQHWKEIFDMSPRQLSPAELEEERELFHSYFNELEPISN